MNNINLKCESAITFCMHTEKMHIFYLKECEQSKHLIVIEEDLLTNGLVSTFVVPKGRNIEATGYILQFNKKSGYLMLSYPPCRFVIWDVNTQETILFTDTRGKNPYFINNFAFNDSSRILFYSAVGQRNIYCCALEEENNTFSFSKNTKLQLPKKIMVHDLKCQPNDKRLVAACSDGIIRIWNQRSMLKGLSDLTDQNNELIPDASGEFLHSKQFYTCLEFSSDGQKLLAGTNFGQIYCYDSRSLGNKHLTLASINVGNSAILSCKWLYYNGLASQKNQHFIAYTSQVSLQLFKYSFQGSLPSLTASKIPSQTKASASITKIQDLYNHRQEIREYYGINLQFEKFLHIHEFANVFAFNTFKTKGQFSQQNRHSFKHTIKLYSLYDKLYDKLDFPLVSPQFNHSFEQLLPNESMDVKMVSVVQGTIRTVASLKQILMSDDVKFYGIDARPLQMDYVGTMKYLLFYKMDDHYYTTSFCVNIERSEEEAKKEDSIEKYLATQSYQAIFLGESHYHNPPIFYLDENMTSFAIDCHLDKIDENISKFLQQSGYSISNDELSVKGDLSQKVERIFSTPFQKGFVILYLLQGENRLCFSRNRLPGQRLLDFELGLPDNNSSIGNMSNSNLVFRADQDDTIIDVLWQNMNTDNPQVQIGAVVCLNKIYFINGNLQKIRVVKVCTATSSNLISSAKWFGTALFYLTRTHVQYVCIDGTTNSVLSLDNYENKQCIAQIMIDRIVIASKSSIKKKQQQAQVEYKTKVFSPVEPMICGKIIVFVVNKEIISYIANCKYLKREIRERDISQLIEVYQTGNISPTLIQCLQKERLHHLCYFYIYNSENKQFPCGQKVEILEQMLKAEGVLDLLFPNKSFTKETDIIEIVRRLQTDPRGVGEFQSLQYLCQYYLLIGEFERALLVCHLLQDFRKMFIISKATNIQPLMNVFASNFLNTKIGCNVHKLERYILKQAISEEEQGSVNQTDNCIESFQTTDNFSYNIINSIENSGKSIRNNEVLQEIAELDDNLAQYMKKVIQRKDTQQSSIVFGQLLYNQVFIDKPDEDDDENHSNIQIVEPMHFENIISYLGVYSTFIEASKTRQEGQSMNMGGGQGQQGMNEEMGGEAGGEEEDENKDILILWRFDEGKGKLVGDLSNYEIEGEVISENGQFDKVWNQLEEGNPLEIEDIWGKKVPPQCSIVFNGDSTFKGIKTVSEKWCNKQKKIKEFTLELWLKAKGGEGPVFKLMDQNETSFEIRIKQYEIQVLVKQNPIKFVAYQEEDENNQSGNPKPNVAQAGENNSIQLQPNVWTHLSIQYEDASKLGLFLNCKELYTSEEDLDLVVYDAFKSKGLYIGSNTFKGEITEFRLRKEKLSVTQIRDQYKTPLPIVSEKKKQIKFKVKKGDNQEDNKPKNQFNFAMPPIMEDNINQFNTNAFNSTNQEDPKSQPQKAGAGQFAFGMPPIISDDIPVSSQQQQAAENPPKGSTTAAQAQNPFVFQMPTIIKDDEYEIKNNEDEEEQKSSSSKKIPSQSNFEQKQNNSIEQKPASNFDDFTAFGTFTQTPQVNKNRSDSNAFSQFQSYSGAQGTSSQHKDFVDPFSQFSTQSKPNQGKNDSFSNFGNDPTSAFGMFGAPQGNEGAKAGSASQFDGFKQNQSNELNEFNTNNFFGGFGNTGGGEQAQNNSFSNFGQQQNKK